MATNIPLNLFPPHAPIGYAGTTPVIQSKEFYREISKLIERVGGASGTGTAGVLPVGISGGIPSYIGSNTVVSSNLLNQYALVLGGGAGATPYTPIGLGDDTNVLHGNATGAPTFQKVNLTTTTTGVLPPNRGGLGMSSYITGDLFQAISPSNIVATHAVATGNALISGGIGSLSSWGKIGLTTHVSGTLPVTNGGTGTNSAFTHSAAERDCKPTGALCGASSSQRHNYHHR